MRLIFAGSSGFALPALARLLELYPPLLIISQPDKPAGRKLLPLACPVAEYALAKGLPLFQPDDVNSPQSLARIASLHPDVIITASYGGMLRKALRSIPRLGAINLHPSLLPLYRGATPIQSALLAGDSLTGATIFRLSARMDAGPILIQRELPILEEDNHSSLEAKLAELSASLLLEILPDLEQRLEQAIEQEHSRATFTAKLDASSSRVAWDQPARAVLNRIRAFSPEPGAYTFFHSSRLKILAAALTDQPAKSHPGSIQELVKNLGFTVNCSDLQLLVKSVQASGKKQMSAWSYLLGARLAVSDSFLPHPITPASSSIPEPNREYT